MAIKAVFYHAGCPVCVDAERMLIGFLDLDKVLLDVVDLGEDKYRISEAEKAGVKTVPALLLNGQVYHINYGADLEVVKNA